MLYRILAESMTPDMSGKVKWVQVSLPLTYDEATAALGQYRDRRPSRLYKMEEILQPDRRHFEDTSEVSE